MTLPTLTVSIGRGGWILGSATKSILGTSTYLGYATFSDITSKVRQVSIRRGRQHELDRVEAGTATVVLMNQDGVFDPLNTSSPYYPDIRPMVPLRIQASWFGGPSEIAGLAAWYDFSDATTLFTDTARTTLVASDGDLLAGVTDKSGLARHITQATSGNRPAYKVVIKNGRSVSRHSADRTRNLYFAGSNTAQPHTLFAVVASSGVGDDWLFDSYDNVAAHTIFGSGGVWNAHAGATLATAVASNTTTWRIYVFQSNGASSKLWLGGGAAISGSAGTNVFKPVRIGSKGSATDAGATATGDFGEFLWYTGALPLTDVNNVGSYLGTRWDTTWTTAT